MFDERPILSSVLLVFVSVFIILISFVTNKHSVNPNNFKANKYCKGKIISVSQTNFSTVEGDGLTVGFEQTPSEIDWFICHVDFKKKLLNIMKTDKEVLFELNDDDYPPVLINIKELIHENN